LALGVALYVTNSVGQFTLVPLLQARTSFARTLLTTPVIYAAVVGMTIKLSGLGIPDWLDETLRLLGGLMIPLMLLALGHTVGGLRARNLRRALGLGSARLLIAFGVAVGVSTALGIQGIAQGVLVLQGSMPAAVFTNTTWALFAREPSKALAAWERAHAFVPELNASHEINRAHALLFLNHQREAKAVYLENKGKPNGTALKQTIEDDFRALRRAGLTHPMMHEVEVALGVAPTQASRSAAATAHR